MGAGSARVNSCPDTGLGLLREFEAGVEWGVGFVVSHPSAKSAEGWGTRRTGVEVLNAASPRGLVFEMIGAGSAPFDFAQGRL
jgi:hypothetical protein